VATTLAEQNPFNISRSQVVSKGTLAVSHTTLHVDDFIQGDTEKALRLSTAARIDF
jgi:hypothetical protein